MHTQLAKMAHDLVSAAPIRGVDAENVAAVKRWLQQINSGEFVVMVKPPMPEPGEIVPK